MIISEDHILQEELNNLTRIPLARAYPLNLIIKNIKKALTHNRNYLLSQQRPQKETKILPIVIPFSNIGKRFTATIHKNWHKIGNDTTLHHLAIQILIRLYQVQQHSQPPCTLCTNIWLLTAGSLILLPTHTRIHQ